MVIRRSAITINRRRQMEVVETNEIVRHRTMSLKYNNVQKKVCSKNIICYLFIYLYNISYIYNTITCAATKIETLKCYSIRLSDSSLITGLIPPQDVNKF